MEKDIKKYVSVKNIVKVILLLLIILFFVPLFTVSCSGNDFEFSAARLTTGYSYQGEKLIDAKIICSLLLILPAAVLVAWFKIKNKKQLNLITGISGLINLVLLLAIIINAKSEAQSSYLEIKKNFGFYLSVFLNLALIGIAICEMTGVMNKIPLLKDNEDEHKPDRLCSKCGKTLKWNYDFCGECGTKYEEVVTNSYCTNCGTQLESKDAFCTNCGSKADI